MKKTALILLLFLIGFNISSYSTEIISGSINVPSDVTTGNFFTVEVTITKENISGFARIVVNVPPGFSAEALKTEGGHFEMENEEVKFIWMKLPEENQFTVSFRMISTDTSVQEIFLAGHFDYVSGNERKLVNFEKKKVVFAATSQLIASNVAKTEIKTNEKLNATAVNKPGSSTPLNPSRPSRPAVRDKPVRDRPSLGEKKKNITPSIYFSVQIASSIRKTTPTQFKKQHRIREDIRVEQIEERYKYFVGKFTSYQEAQSVKEKIADKYNIKGAFIVAFKGGKRVPMQEAIGGKMGK